MTRANVAPTQF